MPSVHGQTCVWAASSGHNKPERLACGEVPRFFCIFSCCYRHGTACICAWHRTFSELPSPSPRSPSSGSQLLSAERSRQWQARAGKKTLGGEEWLNSAPISREDLDRHRRTALREHAPCATERAHGSHARESQRFAQMGSSSSQARRRATPDGSAASHNKSGGVRRALGGAHSAFTHVSCFYPCQVGQYAVTKPRRGMPASAVPPIMSERSSGCVCERSGRVSSFFLTGGGPKLPSERPFARLTIIQCWHMQTD